MIGPDDITDDAVLIAKSGGGVCPICGNGLKRGEDVLSAGKTFKVPMPLLGSLISKVAPRVGQEICRECGENVREIAFRLYNLLSKRIKEMDNVE